MKMSWAARTHRITPLVVLLPLVGCMSMSGLNGKSNYACQAPDGVACDSVAGTYANAIRHNLPAQRSRAAAVPPAAARASASTSAAATAPGFDPLATPLRSEPRVLRLWFKPWEDADHDLYDQGYVYVQIDSGRWLINHAQRAIRDAYRPVRPPATPASNGPEAGEPGAQPPTPFPPITLPAGDAR